MSRASVFDPAASRNLEAVYRTPDIVRQREEVVRTLAPRPGERVLDIGAGPGLLALDIAVHVAPSGRVVALDPSPSMVALSASNVRTSSPPAPVRVVKGDAVRLPFADGAFDAGVATQVYEYVDDITPALDELYRVLRSGGRALILDTDWDSVVWNAADAARMDRMLGLWQRRFAHPYLPRTLTARLRAAGFQVVRRDALVLLNPDYDPDTYSLTNAKIMADYVEQHHAIPRVEVDAWLNDLHRLGDEGSYFFSLNRYLFLAVKR